MKKQLSFETLFILGIIASVLEFIFGEGLIGSGFGLFSLLMFLISVTTFYNYRKNTEPNQRTWYTSGKVIAFLTLISLLLYAPFFSQSEDGPLAQFIVRFLGTFMFLSIAVLLTYKSNNEAKP